MNDLAGEISRDAKEKAEVVDKVGEVVKLFIEKLTGNVSGFFLNSEGSGATSKQHKELSADLAKVDPSGNIVKGLEKGFLANMVEKVQGKGRVADVMANIITKKHKLFGPGKSPSEGEASAYAGEVLALHDLGYASAEVVSKLGDGTNSNDIILDALYKDNALTYLETKLKLVTQGEDPMMIALSHTNNGDKPADGTYTQQLKTDAERMLAEAKAGGSIESAMDTLVAANYREIDDFYASKKGNPDAKMWRDHVQEMNKFVYEQRQRGKDKIALTRDSGAKEYDAEQAYAVLTARYLWGKKNGLIQ